MGFTNTPVASARVRLLADTSSFDKTLDSLESKISRMKSTVALGATQGGGASSGGSSGGGGGVGKLIAGAVAFKGLIGGAMGNLGNRLAYMQGELRVSGQAQMKAATHSAKHADKQLASAKKMAWFAQLAEDRITDAQLATDLDKVWKRMVHHASKVNSHIKLARSDSEKMVDKLSAFTSKQGKIAAPVAAASPQSSMISKLSSFDQRWAKSGKKERIEPGMIIRDSMKSPGSAAAPVSAAQRKMNEYWANLGKASAPTKGTGTYGKGGGSTASMFGVGEIKRLAPYGKAAASGALQGAKETIKAYKTVTIEVGKSLKTALHFFASLGNASRVLSIKVNQWWMVGRHGVYRFGVAVHYLSAPIRAFGSIMSSTLKAGISLFTSYDGRVQKTAGKLGMLGRMASSIANPVRSLATGKGFSGGKKDKAEKGGGGSIMGGGILAGAGMAIGGALIGGVYALGKAFKSSLTAASDLNEAMSYTDSRWGQNAGAVKGFAEALAQSTGAAKTWTLESMNMFGGILQDAGFAEGFTLKMSKNLTQLAQDLSSSRNISVDEAMNKLRGGMTGETEGLKALGIVISETAVKQEAMRLGLIKEGQTLSEAGKQAARYSLIMGKTKADQGDFAKTSGGMANGLRSLQGKWENFLAKIGTSMTPIVGQVANFFGGMLDGAAGWADGISAAMGRVGGVVTAVLGMWSGVFEGVKGIMSALVAWVDTNVIDLDGSWKWLIDGYTEGVKVIGMLFRNWGETWEIIKEIIRTRVINIGEIFTWLVAAGKNVIDWFASDWKNIFKDVFNGVYTLVSNVVHNIGELFKELKSYFTGEDYTMELKGAMEGFQRQSKQLVLPPLKLTPPDEKVIDANLKKMFEKEDARMKERAKPKGEADPNAAPAYEDVNVNAAVQSAGGAVDTTKEKDKKEASFVGLVEFAKQTATNSLKNEEKKDRKGMLEALKGINQNTAAMAKKPTQPAVAGK
jgi:hypothetical protein